MKTDTEVHVNWFRFNIPQILTIGSTLLGVALFLNNGIRDATQATTELKEQIVRIQQTIAPLNNLEYRLTRAEDSVKEAHTRIDNLSNTMINNIDMLRRDVSRLTTQFEVLSAQIQLSMGVDAKEVKQRRARPGGPIPVE